MEDTLIRMMTNAPLSSRQTRVGAPLLFTLSQDVVVDNVLIIPRGATVHGTVVESKQAGAFPVLSLLNWYKKRRALHRPRGLTINSAVDVRVDALMAPLLCVHLPQTDPSTRQFSIISSANKCATPSFVLVGNASGENMPIRFCWGDSFAVFTPREQL